MFFELFFFFFNQRKWDLESAFISSRIYLTLKYTKKPSKNFQVLLERNN